MRPDQANPMVQRSHFFLLVLRGIFQRKSNSYITNAIVWFSAGFVSTTGSCSACSSTGNEWNANVQSVCCCKSKRICLPRGELISGAPERGLPEPVEPKTTVVSSNNRTTHNCVNCQKAGLRGSLNSNEWISTQIFQPIVRVSIVFPKAASFKSLVWMLCAVNVNDPKLRDLCRQTQVVLLPMLITLYLSSVGLGFDTSALLHVVYRYAKSLDSQGEYQHQILPAEGKLYHCAKNVVVCAVNTSGNVHCTLSTILGPAWMNKSLEVKWRIS